MPERMRKDIRAMPLADVATAFRNAARFERKHFAITFEHGTDLVNMVALHGDATADAIEENLCRNKGIASE